MPPLRSLVSHAIPSLHTTLREKNPLPDVFRAIVWRQNLSAHTRDVVCMPQPNRPDTVEAAIIGIDLGTTYSAVAHLDRQGCPVTIPGTNGEMLTPSVVFFDDAGPIVGREALLAAPSAPERLVEGVKRDMGNQYYRKPINGRSVPPPVIASLILRKLKTDAERKLGPVAGAVITVPAYFDELRRQATINAAKLADLTVLELVNEPTAAAIAFGHQEGFLDSNASVTTDRPLKALVYDLGGGTFDVTIIEMQAKKFRVVATDGDVQLGGKEWDDKLLDLVVQKCLPTTREDPRHNPTMMHELYAAVESGKRILSELNQAAIYVTLFGSRFKVDVTRHDFENATAALLGRTRTTVEIVMMQAGLTWGDIDRVIMVGGSTRMPMIERMLKELSGRQPDRSVSPDLAVAHGAALYAGTIAQKRGLMAGKPQFTLHDVNSHSLGIAGTDRTTGRKVNSIVIHKNSPLPCAVTRKFVTARADQRSVKIRVLEGESEVPDACTQVGVCAIRNLPSGLPAGWPIDVRYQYDASGRLKVNAKLRGHEASIDVEFVRNNSLSDDDLLLWGKKLMAVQIL